MNRDVGKATFNWKDDILYVDTFGPFNENGIKSVAENYREVLNNRGGEPFFIIIKWDSETLASLESLPDIQNIGDNLENCGCIAFALIISKQIQIWISKKILPKIGKIFNNAGEAEQWIMSIKNT